MTVYPIQATFGRGELAPSLHGRVDIDHYRAGVQEAVNFQVLAQGGMRRRPGTVYAGLSRAQASAGVLKPFEFNETQAYVLEFTNIRLRIWANGGVVTNTGQSITGITQANPAVVTYSGSDTFANDDRVLITGVVGMVEVNNREFVVANVNTGSNTFQLSGVDSSAYTAYSSGGTVSEIVEVVTTYGTADLPKIQIQQSGDAVYIACEGYPPRKLVRASETSWSIADVDFEDGPYLAENTTATYMTPASSGAVTPKMTSNSLPSGTASNSDGDADAWRVFALDKTNIPNGLAGTAGQWTYDFAGTATKVADAYWITAKDGQPNECASSWTFEGYDGASWIVLDTIFGETGWASQETRYFELANATGYQSYRLNVKTVDGATSCTIAEFGIHESGDTQTAFNLTASSTTGINGGSGFVDSDVGRTIRLMGSDGVWRWAKIAARSSSTVVTIRLYGHSLPDLSKISRWALSAFSAYDGYPRTVGFWQERLFWGGTDTSPRTIWGSRPGDYENHGISTPTADDDAVSLTMTGGKLNLLSWMEDGSDLLIGTTGSCRSVGAAASDSAFSATNAKQSQQSTVGAKTIQPVAIENTVIFANRFGTELHELAFSWEAQSYASPTLTILSDHLFRSGVSSLCFQNYPNPTIWAVVGDGRIQSVAYEKSQQVVGCTQNKIAGGASDTYATVESACVIPTTSGDQVWMLVKRTIGGGTVRYVEYLSMPFEDDDAVADAVFADGSLTYSGSATGTITGLYHLRSESVGILADGVDIGDATVSALGVLTLPDSATGATVTVGKRYTSRIKTLRLPQAGNQDGSALGRMKNISGIKVDVLATAGLEVGTEQQTEELSYSAYDDTSSDVLKTGVFNVPAVDSWMGGGVVVMTTDSMYPATVRSVLLGVEGEP